VALRASTGRIVWDFQAIHHDLWDYDVSAQPSVIDVPRDGTMVPAVVAATKTGFLFLLDRDTGKPLWPVEERPVPASSIPGERAAPTQPFPTLPQPLHPLGVTEADLWGATPADLDACRTQFRQWRSGAMFAPPSFEGTAMYPGFGGGINWGGVAFDRVRKLLVVNSMRLPMWVKLERRTSPTEGNQQGTPYTMVRGTFVAPSGLPCTRPPWGVITAIELATGRVKWEVPLGAMPGTERLPGSAQFGSINLGGPMITAGGLVFVAAAADQTLRALDVETGRELWQAKLPAGGQATPMTYTAGGKQYVVIAAGGHSNLGSPLGDFLVAFALP
jgi:quinoprotein glucose dehydrogenase